MSIFLNPITVFTNPFTGEPFRQVEIFIGRPNTDPLMVDNRVSVFAIDHQGRRRPLQQPIVTNAIGIITGSGGEPISIQHENVNHSLVIRQREQIIMSASNINLVPEPIRPEAVINEFERYGATVWKSFIGYPRFARVFFNNNAYENQVNNNTNRPTHSSWNLLNFGHIEEYFRTVYKQVGRLGYFSFLNNTSTPPDGWLRLDGQQYLDVEAPQLAAFKTNESYPLITTDLGNAAGFVLADIDSVTLRNLGSRLGTEQALFGTVQPGRVGQHTHGLQASLAFRDRGNTDEYTTFLASDERIDNTVRGFSRADMTSERTREIVGQQAGGEAAYSEPRPRRFTVDIAIYAGTLNLAPEI